MSQVFPNMAPELPEESRVAIRTGRVSPLQDLGISPISGLYPTRCASQGACEVGWYHGGRPFVPTDGRLFAYMEKEV